ncbi:MAG: GYD family protein [Deltaproteobacteria bacterium SG8_13]|nr:MAG: GYD family protein [Deltaproteobacteria bacterium SG8_13]
MPTYITLASFTQKGIERIREGPDRLDAAKKEFESLGASIKEFYLVMGQYDMVLVVEAPDDETVAKLALIIGARGTSRTLTLRAFPEGEYRKIVSELP